MCSCICLSLFKFLSSCLSTLPSVYSFTCMRACSTICPPTDYSFVCMSGSLYVSASLYACPPDHLFSLLYVCLSVHQYAHLPMYSFVWLAAQLTYPSTCLSVCSTVYYLIYLSVCLSIRPSVYPSTRLSVHPYVYLFILPHVCPSVCSPICPSTDLLMCLCLSVHRSV
jgi:hypothetical protein